MNLGAFSISLAVKDLEASKAFYEKFGFQAFAGDASQRWLILKNGDHVIGLFQGMFEKNILTFNPGWDSNAQKLAEFTDVRELQRQLVAQGVQLQQQADESATMLAAAAREVWAVRCGQPGARTGGGIA
jgi:lactoylglutathione lyase